MGQGLRARPRKLNDGHLYKNGNTYASFTGGMSESGYNLKAASGIVYPVVPATYNAENIYLLASSGSTAAVSGTQNAIDLTNYSKVYIRYMNTLASTYGVMICAATSKYSSNGVYGDVKACNTLGSTTNVEKTAYLDVSALTGSFYISVCTMGNARVGYVYEIWLQK